MKSKHEKEFPCNDYCKYINIVVDDRVDNEYEARFIIFMSR